MTLKRRTMLTALVSSNGLLYVLPQAWTKPIMQSIVLPAHAETSPASCSGFDVEAIDQLIEITVTDEEVRGPIITSLSADGSFEDTQSLITGECSDGDAQASFSQEVQFSGVIDSVNNEISGDLLIRQFCGDALVCEQISTFSASQTPVDANADTGTYQGQVIGTITCCQDFF